MNTHALARSAYGNPSTVQKSPRSAEYEVISRVTARLRSALRDRTTDFPGLVAALNDNRRLWVALATDIATPGNALPVPLRASILSLAQFTLRQTEIMLAEKNAQGDVLVEINLAILRGLSGKEAVT